MPRLFIACRNLWTHRSKPNVSIVVKRGGVALLAVRATLINPNSWPGFNSSLFAKFLRSSSIVSWWNGLVFSNVLMDC